eukprot:GHVQ01024911.1.p1 GENE.GHVQ01024911.1~~GHVQ01024911.1.p1  ORF type:complete len:215 (+),score=33.95 GHVQ01024911.1:334-978(+)
MDPPVGHSNFLISSNSPAMMLPHSSPSVCPTSQSCDNSLFCLSSSVSTVGPSPTISSSSSCSSVAALTNDAEMSANTNSSSSWMDHPLFMTDMPSADSFRTNPLLSALAALIDETEQEPYAPRRRDKSNQTESGSRCNRSDQGRRQRQSPYSREQNSTSFSYSSSSSNCHYLENRSVTSTGRENPMPAATESSGTDTESFGELQICMSMWKMKD